MLPVELHDGHARVVRALQRAAVDGVDAVLGHPLAQPPRLLLADGGKRRVEVDDAPLLAGDVAARLSVPDQVEADGVGAIQQQDVLEVIRHRIDGRGLRVRVAVGVGQRAISHAGK